MVLLVLAVNLQCNYDEVEGAGRMGWVISQFDPKIAIYFKAGSGWVSIIDFLCFTELEAPVDRTTCKTHGFIVR